MDIRQAIRHVAAGHDLGYTRMQQSMRSIMSGEATPAQIGGFLVALRMKGETADELAGAASVMREFSTRVEFHLDDLVDTCGTGGDGANTFNVSTAAAIVAAAAGAHVAKHGNRSASGRCGSADLLEAAGVSLDLSAEQVTRCIHELGIGFMFAPHHHQAMRHAAGPRRELGLRTIFNLLGPLTNPADARHQLVGVYETRWLQPMAEALQRLGCRRALVVHGDDGIDEISIGSNTQVVELRDGALSAYTLRPEDLGVARADAATLAVRDVQDSLHMVLAVLDKQPGPAGDLVCLNAGAALYVAGLSPTLAQGAKAARAAIETGAARAKLQALVELSQSLTRA